MGAGGEDGTRKSRAICAAHYMLYASLSVGGTAEKGCLSQRAGRDTPIDVLIGAAKG